MEVYVIPAGRERYELYCESPTPVSAADATEPATGWLSRLRHRFTAMVDEAEERERATSPEPAGGTWLNRLQVLVMAWVAERIAEQRLLWNLRHEVSIRLFHPDDMTFAQAHAIVTGALRIDHDRHRFWLIVNAALMVVTGPLLFFIPGPNLVAYYFTFRVVGHWFSMRGASQGLHRVTWQGEASVPLTELRAALLLADRERRPKVEALAAGLGLPRLAAFVERLASR